MPGSVSVVGVPSFFPLWAADLESKLGGSLLAEVVSGLALAAILPWLERPSRAMASGSSLFCSFRRLCREIDVSRLKLGSVGLPACFSGAWSTTADDTLALASAAFASAWALL